MYSEDFQFYVEHLTSDNPYDVGYGVGSLTAIDVEGDERLLPLLEPLLEDERIVRMPAAPISYSEIRWMAADAIGTQRYLLGLPERNISRFGFMCPGSYGTLVTFAEIRHGIKDSDLYSISYQLEDGGSDTIADLEYLKKLGVLPVCNLEEPPYVDLATHLAMRGEEEI